MCMLDGADLVWPKIATIHLVLLFGYSPRFDLDDVHIQIMTEVNASCQRLLLFAVCLLFSLFFFLSLSYIVDAVDVCGTMFYTNLNSSHSHLHAYRAHTCMRLFNEFDKSTMISTRGWELFIGLFWYHFVYVCVCVTMRNGGDGVRSRWDALATHIIKQHTIILRRIRTECMEKLYYKWPPVRSAMRLCRRCFCFSWCHCRCCFRYCHSHLLLRSFNWLGL